MCGIWLHEKNSTPERFERLAAARGIRGGIALGHYHSGGVPAEFRAAMERLKFVSMGVNPESPVKCSVFMDRFLMVKGFAEKIMRPGCARGIRRGKVRRQI